MKIFNFIFYTIFYLSISSALESNYATKSDVSLTEIHTPKNEKNFDRQLNSEKLHIIENNRKILQMIKEVEEQFSKEKSEKTSNLKIPELLIYYNRNANAYSLIKRRWNEFKFPIGSMKKEISLPVYLQNIDSLATTFGVENNVNVNDLIEASQVNSNISNSEMEVLQYKDECDPEYGENILRKFIKKICSKIDDKQKKILANIASSIVQINTGSVEAVFTLLSCLKELEEDTFDILKQILVIIDKLIEIKSNSVKLVIEMVIESLGNVIKKWEDKKCGCECPGFLHSLLKYIIDIITWTPKKKIKQSIEHIFDIFTSIPWFRCTCACEGFFALSAEGVDERQDSSQAEQSQILNKRELRISPLDNSPLVDDVSIESINRSKRKDIRRQKIGNSQILQKVDQILVGKMKQKELREQKPQKTIQKSQYLYQENDDLHWDPNLRHTQNTIGRQYMKYVPSERNGRLGGKESNQGHTNTNFHDNIYRNADYQKFEQPKYQKTSSRNRGISYYKDNERETSDNYYNAQPSRDYLQKLNRNDRQNHKSKVTKKMRVMEYQK